MIFALLSFLLSPFGLLAGLLGLVTFLFLPLASKLPGDGKRGAGVMLWLAQTAAGRGAIVVSEAGETLFKTLDYTDQGTYRARFSSNAKLFEDPGDTMHRLAGKAFALADEKHGVLFDPRFPAVGERKREAEEKEEMFFKATGKENKTYAVRGWVRGVFSLPEKNELVNLTSVRPLISGGERAEYGPKVKQLYKFSRNPYTSSKALLRLLLPVIAFLMVLGGMWLISDQMSSGGGGGGTPDTTVSMLLLTLPVISDRVRRLARSVMLVALPLLAVVGLAAVTSVVFAALTAVTFVLGFLALPALTFLTMLSSRLSGALAGLWFRLGLLGYDRPVFNWTPEKYEIREYADLDAEGPVRWYDLAGSQVGFTFAPGVESFAEGWTADDVENNSELAADGGPKSNIPPGYVRSEALRRGPYGGFVPSSPDDDRVYVKAGRFLRRLAPAATGEKSKKSLSAAREKFGIGWAAQMSDKTIAYMTFVLVLIAAGLGTWLFFLGGI